MKKQVSINHEWILRHFNILTLLVSLLVFCHNSIASGESADWIQVENKSVPCKTFTSSTDSVSWTGDCNNGLINGYGVLDIKGKYKYEGECRDGLKNGRGVMTWTDGEKYDGDFKDGKYHGRGVIIYPTGNKYDGEWKDYKKHGRGVFTWSSGEKYEGEWKDDKRNGRGVQIDSRGDKYDVEWKDDKKHGRGVLITSGGDKYEGEWKDDEKSRGVLITSEGDKYEGEWEAVAKARAYKFLSKTPEEIMGKSAASSSSSKKTKKTNNQSSSSSSSSQEEKANSLSLQITFGSFWHGSADRTVVKVKRIKTLAGKSVYYEMPYERKSEESSGIFNIPITYFYDPPYGYYKVEVMAYQKSSERSTSFEVELLVDRKDNGYELNIGKDNVQIHRYK